MIIQLKKELAELREEKELAEKVFIIRRRLYYGRKNWKLPNMDYFNDHFSSSLFNYIIKSGTFNR